MVETSLELTPGLILYYYSFGYLKLNKCDKTMIVLSIYVVYFKP